MPTPNGIYQLHLSLHDSRPLVWRRLWVSASTSLIQLNRIFQICMGWRRCPAHEFLLSGARYGYGYLADEDSPDLPRIDERRLTIGGVLQTSVNVFHYRCDSRGGWEHRVMVESLLARDAKNRWTQCIGGANACPPEGMNHPATYSAFVLAMADPHHVQHLSLRRWYGGPFDPHAFDANAVNRLLRKLRL